MVDSHSALTKRHKASLQSFIDKNDWIQGKIDFLERSTLSAIDAESWSLDDAALSQLLQEHEGLEAEVQDVDNGELQALRLLAKAASSHKNLSPEDTDLIEITLKVLFSVDKLLHLLRIRGKQLYLIQLKNKWTASVKKTKADCHSILHEVLPRFVSKARWKEPQGLEEYEKRQARLSNASVASNASEQASPSSIRTTMTNSNMARQMRAEILSLDLATLASRIHTLSHSTLAAKILDSMVDASPVPLPESFLDLQDELEARIKRDLSGILDFCHALTSQWKQVDEVYWTCRDLRLSSEVLARDIEQATLKLPSEVLADTFQGRLQALLSKYDAACIPVITTLPTPLLQAQVPDQAMYNQQVVDTVRLTTQSTSLCLNGCRQAVEAYRNAAQALAAAQTYHAHINETLATIRQHVSSLKRIPFDISTVSASDVDFDSVAGSIRALSRTAENAHEIINSKSQNIIIDLLNAGIDPNVRRSLQESISALQRDAKQALHLSNFEDSKLSALDQLRKTLLLLADDRNHLLKVESTLTVSIEQVLDGESGNSPSDAVELTAQIVSLRHQIAEHLASCSVAEDSLGRLSASLSDEVLHLQRYLQGQVLGVQEHVNNVQNMLDLLQRALAQRKETELARKRAFQLQNDSDNLRTVLSSASLDTVDLQRAALQQEKLDSRFKAFKESLVVDVSFLSRSSPSRKFDLASHDQSIRVVLNDMSAGIESSVHQTAREVETFRKRLEAKERLQAEQARLEVIVAQGEGVRSSIEHMSGERLKQLESAKTDLLSLLRGCAKMDNLQIEGVDRTQASRDLVDIRTSLSVRTETVIRTLNSMILNVETELSAEKARQVAANAKAEDERADKARRAAVEAQYRANIAKLDMIEESAHMACASAATMLQHLRDVVWTGLGSDQHCLDDYHHQVEAYCIQADALQVDFSLILDQFSDIGISVDSNFQNHRNVRAAATNEAVDDSLRAAVDLREAEEEAVAMCQAALRRQGTEKEAGERSVKSEQMELVSDPLESAGTERVLLPNAKATDSDASQSKEVGEMACNPPQSPPQQGLQREALIGGLSVESDAAFSTSEDVFGPRLSTIPGVQVSSASTSSVFPPDLCEAALHHPKGNQTVAEDEHFQEGSLTSASEGSNRIMAQHSIRSAPSADTEGNDIASRISAFKKAAAAADKAISRTMDLVDGFEENEDASTSLWFNTDQVQHTLLAAEKAALPLGTDSSAQTRLLHLQTVWHGLQEHIDALQERSRHTIARSASLSRASSSSSVSKTFRRSASSRVLSRKVSDRNGREPTRASSMTASSRLPVAASRARKQSLASIAPTTASPAPSRLPRPMSASSKTFQSPTIASASRKQPTMKHYNTLSPFGIPRLPTPFASRAISTQVKEDQDAVPSPSRHRTSNRRSSAGHSVDLDAKPNSYRPKPNHKLDMAVGKIVNNMPISVTVTPAEVHRDEVGKYWIGDPPRLYYARILRSRTVMLRVGGGWQELGNFLSTHFDQIFSSGEGIHAASNEVGDHSSSTPKVLEQHGIPGDVPWLSSSSMKASQSNLSSRRESFRSPRSASVHISPLKHSLSGGELPFDLTALLMKSVSHSPPVARPRTSQRNVSAPMAWKI